MRASNERKASFGSIRRQSSLLRCNMCLGVSSSQPESVIVRGVSGTITVWYYKPLQVTKKRFPNEDAAAFPQKSSHEQTRPLAANNRAGFEGNMSRPG